MFLLSIRSPESPKFVHHAFSNEKYSLYHAITQTAGGIGTITVILIDEKDLLARTVLRMRIHHVIVFQTNHSKEQKRNCGVENAVILCVG